jgi:hypothetical protein
MTFHKSTSRPRSTPRLPIRPGLPRTLSTPLRPFSLLGARTSSTGSRTSPSLGALSPTARRSPRRFGRRLSSTTRRSTRLSTGSLLTLRFTGACYLLCPPIWLLCLAGAKCDDSAIITAALQHRPLALARPRHRLVPRQLDRRARRPSCPLDRGRLSLARGPCDRLGCRPCCQELRAFHY